MPSGGARGHPGWPGGEGGWRGQPGRGTAGTQGCPPYWAPLHPPGRPCLTPACGWPPVCVSELSGGQLVYEPRAGFKRKGHFWECGRAGAGQGPGRWREGGGPAGASSPACPDHSGPATRGEPRKAVGSRRAGEARREACPADRARACGGSGSWGPG